MRKLAAGVLVLVLVGGVWLPSALAFQCPSLVKECKTLADKIEKRAGSDTAKVTAARAECDKALTLHEGGKHKDAVMAAGHGIMLAAEAAK